MIPAKGSVPGPCVERGTHNVAESQRELGEPHADAVRGRVGMSGTPNTRKPVIATILGLPDCKQMFTLWLV